MAGPVMVTKGGGCGGRGSAKRAKTASAEEEDAATEGQLSMVEALLSTLRKSMASCRVERDEDVISSVHHRHMEIGWPTNVRHITHVTFDRFHGFLGLPDEFEVEVPSRSPSASVTVFGVSPESMQCSYDPKGNSVPSILMLMQERLYSQEGLKAEGIFRINPENSQEEHLRDQLNRGIIPNDIDVHCLAGLIKAWFRELPSGVLDGLSPDQVLQCNTEEESVELVKQLKPTEASLLNWAVELMADVVEEEEFNKMNARNIAMVFAPNMTQMSDPLTALMHAVQVMNLLKMLIMKTSREREEIVSGHSPISSQSYDDQSDCNYDTQQEEMDNSSELRGDSLSDNEYDHGNNFHTEEEEEEEAEEEAGSLGEIEECFLRQLGYSEAPSRDSFTNQLVDPESPNHEGCSMLNAESGISFTDSAKNGTSLSTTTTSDEEDGTSCKLISTLRISKSTSQRKEFKMSPDEEMGKSPPPVVRILI
ncbi:hypothetical protein SAY87_023539 [Trapa incisa]|uniref:Rho GTPase-activating protein 2 n=1 Tax=Trapa incisa TaxID=236973 RepID=A0AAN7QUB5_9MYRT|nr:hypothetical protein SAY87_023539 [Trapa incisa]